MTWASERRVHGQTNSSRKSRFLNELPRDGVQVQEMEAPRWDSFGRSSGRDWTADDGWSAGSRWGRSSGKTRQERGDWTQPDEYYARAKKNRDERLKKATESVNRGGASEAQVSGGNSGTGAGSDLLHVGDRVKHMKFGAGTVKEVKFVNADYQVRVVFDTAGEKLMFAKLAKLKKI